MIVATTKQLARILAASDRDARHQFPSLHDEAMEYRKRFGTAKGMLEGIVVLIEDEELPIDVRAKMLAYQIARTKKALEEWGK